MFYFFKKKQSFGNADANSDAITDADADMLMSTVPYGL